MGINLWIPTGLILSAFFVAFYLAARSKMFKSGHLFASTPEHDVENVKTKHFKLRIVLFATTFLPIVLLLSLDILLKKCASVEFQQIVKNAVGQYIYVAIAMFVFLAICSKGIRPGRHFEIFEEPYILTRYMIYPKLPASAGLMTGIIYSLTGAIAGFIYPFYESNITIRNSFDFTFGILFFVLELAIVYLSNYAIIGWYDNTSNDFLFDKVDYTDYDKAAKRYYGIWRNRLILANIIACAQLVLGGFVTLTNAGENLMGIRILGLVILAVVFSYILIQSRDFDAPVVVKGMVYPSEKKRVILKWVILSAVIVYILGVVVLL